MNTCPRCGDVPPSDDPWHRGVGASSRIDNRTKICNKCGIEEALQDFMGTGESRLTPKEDWASQTETEMTNEEAAELMTRAIANLNKPDYRDEPEDWFEFEVPGEEESQS